MFFFFKEEDGIRDLTVTGVQTCALPISSCCPVAPCYASGSCASRPRPARGPSRLSRCWNGPGPRACRARRWGRSDKRRGARRRPIARTGGRTSGVEAAVMHGLRNLVQRQDVGADAGVGLVLVGGGEDLLEGVDHIFHEALVDLALAPVEALAVLQIGRASCREREKISVDAV